ncbi:Zinc finger, CCHC-type [Sesbania bispinosa]|nr:Zinc finger, CCHC-type [Sesbania bispinosa]
MASSESNPIDPKPPDDGAHAKERVSFHDKLLRKDASVTPKEKGRWYQVEYESLHLICGKCGLYGHVTRSCTKKEGNPVVSSQSQESQNPGDEVVGMRDDEDVVKRFVAETGKGIIFSTKSLVPSIQGVSKKIIHRIEPPSTSLKDNESSAAISNLSLEKSSLSIKKGVAGISTSAPNKSYSSAAINNLSLEKSSLSIKKGVAGITTTAPSKSSPSTSTQNIVPQSLEHGIKTLMNVEENEDSDAVSDDEMVEDQDSSSADSDDDMMIEHGNDIDHSPNG